jgi:cell filamentation protein
VTINVVSASDRLPQRLRHCVDQTIAAEVLEGWRPTAEQVAALVALVDGGLAFGDYLRAYTTSRDLQPTRDSVRRRYHRRTQYLIPGTSLLRNNFGVDTREKLADLEFVATAGRMACWHRAIADGELDVRAALDARALHRELFADVYAWAGSYRVTELRLGDEVFARRSSVHRMMGCVEAQAHSLVADADHHDDALAEQLARLYADYNYIHPFREGNGRTGTSMLHLVTAMRGRRLDLSSISRAQWYAASRDSMPVGRDRRADPSPFVPLFVRALGQRPVDPFVGGEQ